MTLITEDINRYYPWEAYATSLSSRQCNGEALTKEQTLREYCVNRSISQSSRLKFNWKLFVINEEYLKGVRDFFKLW